jgi:CO/xanthine dehydrogenase FAD-binding subunit
VRGGSFGEPSVTDYVRPDALDEALAVLSRGPVTVAAGCTDLYPATERARIAGPVLDLTGIGSLRAITREAAGGWRIGAAATWTDILRADLPSSFRALKEAAREVGSVQIQNAGTIGGNLCNASPAADGVPCLMALDARVELQSTARGTRVLAVEEFLTGPRRTAREPDEILTAILIPEAAERGVSAFQKLGARAYLVISIAMTAARLVIDGGRITEARVAVGACSPVARRIGAVEAALVGRPVEAAVLAVDEAAVAAALSPIADVRADAAYRARAAAELVRRAVRRAAEGRP